MNYDENKILNAKEISSLIVLAREKKRIDELKLGTHIGTETGSDLSERIGSNNPDADSKVYAPIVISPLPLYIAHHLGELGSYETGASDGVISNSRLPNGKYVLLAGLDYALIALAQNGKVQAHIINVHDEINQNLSDDVLEKIKLPPGMGVYTKANSENYGVSEEELERAVQDIRAIKLVDAKLFLSDQFNMMTSDTSYLPKDLSTVGQLLKREYLH